ncbi:unnamed protein product [Moneuplotes crassus]|uniref:Uncharacterized protein n=1 Tax=Euplotes crassus TaxID=5936 RepID=A0AAD1XHR8_EUPCR|nr:unnamed protein product [Moneuplotes crassus]
MNLKVLAPAVRGFRRKSITRGEIQTSFKTNKFYFKGNEDKKKHEMMVRMADSFAGQTTPLYHCKLDYKKNKNSLFMSPYLRIEKKKHSKEFNRIQRKMTEITRKNSRRNSTLSKTTFCDDSLKNISDVRGKSKRLVKLQKNLRDTKLKREFFNSSFISLETEKPLIDNEKIVIKRNSSLGIRACKSREIKAQEVNIVRNIQKSKFLYPMENKEKFLIFDVTPIVNK